MRSVGEPDACRECQEAIASCHKAAVIGGEEPGHGSRFVRAAQTAMMAAANWAGTPRPALGNSCFPSGSIKQTIEAARGAWASMAAHKLFRTSGRLAPSAIISSVRFSAATRDSACDCDRAVVRGPCLDSDPAGLSTPAAALSCVFWSGLSRRSGEPITFSIWIPVYAPRVIDMLVPPKSAFSFDAQDATLDTS